MKNTQFRKYLNLLASLLLVLVSAGPQAEIAQMPLYLSTVPGKPNIMLMVDNSGSMSNTVTVNGTRQGTRLSIAKAAATAMVSQLTPASGAQPTVRMGLAVYRNTSDGGRLVIPLDELSATPRPSQTISQATKINNAINGLSASTATPLATALLDIGYYYTTGNNTGNVTLHPGSNPSLQTIAAAFTKTSGSSPRLGPSGFDSSQSVPRTCPTTTTVIVPDNCIIPASGASCQVNVGGTLTTYTPPCPCTNYVAGGASTLDLAADTVTYPPIQMLVVGTQPTICTGTTAPYCADQRNFNVCQCTGGLSSCQTCTANTTGTVQDISYAAGSPAIAATTQVTASPHSTYSTSSSVVAVNGIRQALSATVTPPDPNNTTGNLLSFTTTADTTGVCSLMAGSSGTTTCAPGSSNCYIQGKNNGVCRVCAQYAGSTGAQTCTAGGGSCLPSQEGQQVCPNNYWNSTACTSTSGGYYTKNNTDYAIPAASINSCTWHTGDNISGTSYNPPGDYSNTYYPCARCSCWNGALCRSTSGKFCSNDTANSCTGDSGCYTATCRAPNSTGSCSNASNSCSTGSDCSFGNCTSQSTRNFCSNSLTTSCNGDSNCQVGGLACSGSYNVCSTDPTKTCTQSSECNTPNPTCQSASLRCSNALDTSCVIYWWGDSCGWGQGTCQSVRICSNQTKSCTSNAQCLATCGGTGFTGKQICSNSGANDGKVCTSADQCDDGLCQGYHYCWSNNNIACPNGNECSGNCRNMSCSNTGAACTGNSDCNPNVTCKDCNTVAPATCNCTSGTGAACVVDTLDIPVGNGTVAQCPSGTDNGSTGGTLTVGNQCFNPSLYYTVQYNGGDIMGPYRGDQLNWYFKANTGFSEGTLQLPGTIATDDTGCTTATAPIQNYCQKSFAILISDGLPNGDRTVGSLLADYTGDCATKHLCDATRNTIQLPNLALTASGTKCNTTTGTYNLACQNGTQVGYNYAKSGGGNNGSDYLDDVAAALYDMDLRPDLRRPAVEAANAKNNVITYGVGFADPSLDPSQSGPSVFSRAAAAGGGKFYYAADATALAAALASVISNISAQIGSSASVAANSTQASGSSLIYQAKFDSGNWYGDLVAYPINLVASSGGYGGLGDLQWNAATLIPNDGALTNNVYNASSSGRTILTYNPSATSNKGTVFSCANLSATQKTYLGIGSTSNCATNTTDQGIWRLNWLRGDKTHEEVNSLRVLASGQSETRLIASGGTDCSLAANAANAACVSLKAGLILRNRTRLDPLTNMSMTPDPWLLGDIVDSSPVYVGTPDWGYGVLSPEGGSYGTFLSTYSGRRPMIYVGANDGMLHGFDAGTGTAAGKEQVAYVPDAVYPNLANLTSTGYAHHYFVDGAPAAADAYFGSAWHTVLVGTTGAGAQAAFALDITNPGTPTSTASNFSGSNVLWEVSTTQAPTPADLTTDTSGTSGVRGFQHNLGYTLSQPSIVRMHDGSWAALFANGYQSANNLAVLYIVSVADGHIIRALNPVNTNESAFVNTGANYANGLSTPFAADVDGDKIVDYIYAGDLRGNLWKFDVTGSTAASWGVANSGSPLFVACDDDEVLPCEQTHRQPITSRPVVGLAKSTAAGRTGGYMVYFGTGKYFESTDNNLTSPQTQTFYGIWDNGAAVPSGTGATTTRSNLIAHTITSTTTINGNSFRTTSNNGCGNQGWLMNLTDAGERVISFPLLNNNRVIFTTLVPLASTNADSCTTVSSGTGWLMELSAICGTPLDPSLPPWDVNGDGKIDSSDLIPVNGQPQSPSGMKSTVGIPTAPAILRLPCCPPDDPECSCDDRGKDQKFLSGSTGGVMPILESGSSGNSTPPRQSWSQIR